MLEATKGESQWALVVVLATGKNSSLLDKQYNYTKVKKCNEHTNEFLGYLISFGHMLKRDAVIVHAQHYTLHTS